MINQARREAFVLAIVTLLVGGCGESTPIPGPQALTRDAIGQYCRMIVADHPGPKAQVHEQGNRQPLWFSSVRDAFAYLALAGEAQSPTAVYVHDMGRASNWGRPPRDGTWVRANDAVYVINSRKRGGMGAQETVPFVSRNQAAAFVAQFGGEIVAYEQVPREYIIGDTNDHAPSIDHRNSDRGVSGNRS